MFKLYEHSGDDDASWELLDSRAKAQLRLRLKERFFELEFGEIEKSWNDVPKREAGRSNALIIWSCFHALSNSH